MSAQKDLIAGLDLSPLSDVEQEDIMQAINGLAPLSNIGFVFEGTSQPDIANNPRMIRYFWLDTTDPDDPVVKRYVGDRTTLTGTWEELGVANGAILTAMIAIRSVTGGVDLTRMKLNSDYSASPGSIYYVLRVAANGKDIEAVNIATAIQDGGGVTLDLLSLSGSGARKYLGIVTGALEYKYLDPANDFTSGFGNRIPIETAIQPGTARYIPRTNAGGTALEWITPGDLFTNREVPAESITQGGAATNDLLRWDGANWSKVTPTLKIVASDAINSGDDTPTSGTGRLDSAGPHTWTHGLGGTPKLIRVVAINTTGTEAGYTTTDEVEISAIGAGGGAANLFCAISADSTTITIVLRAVAGLEIPAKTTGVATAITEANWKLKVYAWI